MGGLGAPKVGLKWMFPKIGVPQNGWFLSWKTLLKLMIWGYHYVNYVPLFLEALK